MTTSRLPRLAERSLLAVLAAGTLVSCVRQESATHPSVVVARLEPGRLGALRDSFNAAVDRPRLLVLLSPT